MQLRHAISLLVGDGISAAVMGESQGENPVINVTNDQPESCPGSLHVLTIWHRVEIPVEAMEHGISKMMPLIDACQDPL